MIMAPQSMHWRLSIPCQPCRGRSEWVQGSFSLQCRNRGQGLHLNSDLSDAREEDGSAACRRTGMMDTPLSLRTRLNGSASETALDTKAEVPATMTGRTRPLRYASGKTLSPPRLICTTATLNVMIECQQSFKAFWNLETSLHESMLQSQSLAVSLRCPLPGHMLADI